MNLDDGEWAVDDDEGLFDDSESIFGDEGLVDQENRTVSRVEDARMQSPPAVIKSGASTGVALVAVFDERGEPLVARHQMREGRPRPLEEFRRPTPDEYNSIMFGGKIVRGGVVGSNVPTTTNLGPTMMKTPLGQTNGGTDWKKVALYGIGGIALIGGGYWAYRWWQERR